MFLETQYGFSGGVHRGSADSRLNRRRTVARCILGACRQRAANLVVMPVRPSA